MVFAQHFKEHCGDAETAFSELKLMASKSAWHWLNQFFEGSLGDSENFRVAEAMPGALT